MSLARLPLSGNLNGRYWPLVAVVKTGKPTGFGVIEFEHVGTAADPLRLLLILRADRRAVDLVALGVFERLPDESVNALKARIERQHRAGLLMLHATYVEPGRIAD